MTPSERIALKYISGIMEANAAMLGRCIYNSGYASGSNIIAIGSNVIGRLKKRGYISRVPELRAWQITRAGRDAIGQETSRTDK